VKLGGPPMMGYLQREGGNRLTRGKSFTERRSNPGLPSSQKKKLPVCTALRASDSERTIRSEASGGVRHRQKPC